MRFESVRYRSVFTQVLAVIVAVLCAVGAGTSFLSGVADGVQGLAVYALIAYLGWLLFWQPRLEAEPFGVTIVNVFTTVFLPWPAIQAIDTKYALTFHTAKGKVSVWAAPASGRHRVLGLSKGDFSGVSKSAHGEHNSLRPSDATSSPTGNLAEAIRRQWEALGREGAFDKGVDPSAQTTTLHVRSIATLAVLAALAVLSLLL